MGFDARRSFWETESGRVLASVTIRGSCAWSRSGSARRTYGPQPATTPLTLPPAASQTTAAFPAIPKHWRARSAMAFRFKELLARDELVRVFSLGRFLSPITVDLFALVGGFHGCWLDQEHVGLSYSDVQLAAVACRANGFDCFVRMAPDELRRSDTKPRSRRRRRDGRPDCLGRRMPKSSSPGPSSARVACAE